MWNNFVAESKNATFLFHRNFMDYHSNRFEDYSLLVYKNDKLIALLPLNKKENEVVSHQGLSYGGLLFSKKIKFKESLESFKSILNYLASHKIQRFHLNVMPKIYHIMPADEIDYLLFLTDARLTRTDLSSTIDLGNPIKIQSNRMEGVKKAKKLGLTIKEDANFTPFWNDILIPNLKAQHDATPVHSLDEIEKLAKNFPQNIIQFSVYKEEMIVAGATIFETEHLVHVQYISANAQKQQLGSLDFLFHYLITERYKGKRYFDFGISNVNNGKQMNDGLLYWKECFGARGISHQFYTIETTKYSKLDSVFL